MCVNITVLLIQGLVQGVGFRPFVYRIATEMGIRGEVDNRNDGVCIRALLSVEEKELLLRRIRTEHPPVASIHRIQVTEEQVEAEPYTGFSITPSRNGSAEITQVSPDIAVCADCLADRKRQPHRLAYPFVNCTHCGPRFSIIRDLPYDRARTTMAAFSLCPDCRKEYTSVGDRRFHAQPVACNRCGPVYYASYEGRKYTDYPTLLALTIRLLAEGRVIAAKGIGGYHLVCDACQEKAVGRLREIKARETKPFAVMFRDVQSVQTYAHLHPREAACLTSWRRPIVLLKCRFDGVETPLASGVHPSMQTVGCLLPYMPIHTDWFEHLDTPALVMTSGNQSDFPIAVTPREAESQLEGKVDLILHHNREIYNRTDDSVLQVCGSQPCLLRRSRGYVPEPFRTELPVDGILAFGAEMANTFALGKGGTILQSQYIGDLKNSETYAFYTESLDRFRQLFRFTPRRLVGDKHPDYLSSREASGLALAMGLPLLGVQHHHAHAAACMLEHGLKEPVIALVLDGTGWGEDGHSWGGEFFWCDLATYRRLAHFEYVPLPGGDKAAMEPWRMAVAYLRQYGLPYPPDFVGRIGADKIRVLERMLEKGVQCPSGSSAGRLFDAVSSLAGLCDRVSRQGEAAILWEQEAAFYERCGKTRYSEPDTASVPSAAIPFSRSAESATEESYPLADEKDGILSFRPLFARLLADKMNQVPAGLLAIRFHEALAACLKDKAVRLMRQTGVSKVIASGGCFQNKRLTELLQQQFKEEGIPFYIPGRIPCNDSGIAVGQVAVAAALAQKAADASLGGSCPAFGAEGNRPSDDQERKKEGNKRNRKESTSF